MSDRGLDPEIVAASTKTVVRPFFAVELEFDSPNQLYFWSGVGDLTIGATTYTGAGDLLQLSDVRESADIGAYGATMSLSGIPSDLISLALGEPYQGRICRIKFGLLDFDLLEDAYLLVGSGEYLIVDGTTGRLDLSSSQPATLFELFSGYMDQMNISEGPETSNISLAVESRMIDLEKPRSRRYTDKSQQARYSGDLAFEFVARLQDETFEWGT